MKNLLVQFAFILTILVSTFSTATAQYQTVGYNNTSVDQTLMARVLATKLFLEGTGYTITGTTEFNLSEGESWAAKTKFHPGHNYTILAITGDGVIDLDMALYHKSGRLLRADRDSDDTGVAGISDFRTHKKRNLRLLVKNHDSETSYRNHKVVLVIAAK